MSTQIRATRHQRDLGFIIIVDGDSVGFKARPAEVKNALRGTQAGDADGLEDRVAILVPAWSIETWLRHFEGASVTEATSLKTEVHASRIGELSSKAADAWDSASVEGLPALLAARQQLAALLGRGS
jgi:hypothetical protein